MSEPYKEKDLTLAVPGRYAGVQYEDAPENIRKMFETIRSTRTGIYLHGDVGTGKTHIAYALYRYARTKCPMGWEETKQSWEERGAWHEERPIFWNTTELFRELRLDFDRAEGKQREEERLMKHRGILFIDDIGSERSSDWVMETFYLIINKRYNEKLPMIFTSNLNIPQLASAIGDRIASRIVETCEIVELTGVDRRKLNVKKTVI